VEDPRIGPLQLPGREERRPVDEGNDVGEIDLLEHARAREGRAGDLVGAPVDGRAAATGFGQGEERLARPLLLVGAAELLLVDAVLGCELLALLGTLELAR